MSGYFAMVRFDAKNVDEMLLEEIKNQLSARGPDGANVWTDGRLGSAFSLLLTGPGKQATHQPQTPDGRYWLWGDVRLDDRVQLLSELKGFGSHIGTEASSEELLLHAWKIWGEGCLQKVIGDFSFGLWDAEKQCLWGARDFVGARPFFYANVGGALLFSNTLEVLRYAPEISTALDEQFIGDFLLEGCNPDQSRTVFRDVKRLPPGHLLEFKDGRVEVRRFFKLAIEDPVQLQDPEQYVQAYRELLQKAVKDRLPKNPVALYLSGGLDSSSVCAVAAEIASDYGRLEGLKAFTLSCNNWFADEEPGLAKLTAAHLGIRHEILEDSKLELFEDAEERGLLTPEPNEEPFVAQAQRECQKIAEHSHVILSGDGGDNILTGQGWPYFVYLWRRRNWRQIVRDFGGYLYSHGRIPPIRGGFKSRIEQALRGKHAFDEYPVWLNEEFERRINLKQRWRELRETKIEEHPVHPLAYSSLHGTYWASVLETEDAGWNRIPLETRAPLLDLRIVRFLLTLPPVPWCARKELCRQTMKGHLPERVVQRPKKPLAADPVSIALKLRPWRPRLEALPIDSIKPFVNWEKWQATFQDGKGSLRQGSHRLLSLLYWMKAVENRQRIL